MPSSISLCIPSKNRHASITRCMPSWLRAVDACAGELLILDQSPRPYAFTHPRLRILHAPDCNGLPAARNRLIRAAQHPLCCMCDDDSLLAEDALLQASRFMAAQPTLTACGPVLETRSAGTRRLHRIAQLGAMRDERRLLVRRCTRRTEQLFGACFVVRRDLAGQVGWREDFSGYALGEDFDFFTRYPGPKSWLASMRAAHLCEQQERADGKSRGTAKARWLHWQARQYGRQNPASLLHWLLALMAASSGMGREKAAMLSVWRTALDQ